MPNGFAFRTKGRSDYQMQFYSALQITAIAPSSQTTATLMVNDTNLVNVVPSGGAVKLPRAEAGRAISVINGTPTNTLAIWPYSGDGINTQSINTVLSGGLAPNTAVIFYCGVQGTWWSK